MSHQPPLPAPSQSQPQSSTTGEPPGLFRFTSTWPPAWRQAIRHPGEIPWLIVAIVLWALNLVLAIVLSALSLAEPQAFNSSLFGPMLLSLLSTLLQITFAVPFVLLLVRGVTYAQMRTSGTRMSPTQFPEGYRMVVEAAEKFGLRRVPDAYVVMGNGQVNAFAAGHGHRRFVVVYSDLFELGGEARDQNVLRFVIGHEVGHLAAGHVGYFRLVVSTALAQVPLLGTILTRAQEYTADNYGYHYHAAGASGLPRLFGAGKYLNGAVQVDEFTDRALTERGFFVWVANLLSTHPVPTWRSLALRNRMQPGALFFMPKGTIVGQSVIPPGQIPSHAWPTPSAMLRYLDANPSEHASFPTPVMQPLPPRAPLSPGWFQPGPELGGPGKGGPTPGAGGGAPGQGGHYGGVAVPGGYGAQNPEGQGYGSQSDSGPGYGGRSASGSGYGGQASSAPGSGGQVPSGSGYGGQPGQGYGSQQGGAYGAPSAQTSGAPSAQSYGTPSTYGASTDAGSSSAAPSEPAPSAPTFGTPGADGSHGAGYGSAALGGPGSTGGAPSDGRATDTGTTRAAQAESTGAPDVTRRSLRAQESSSDSVGGAGVGGQSGSGTTADADGSWPTVGGTPSAYGSSGASGSTGGYGQSGAYGSGGAYGSSGASGSGGAYGSSGAYGSGGAYGSDGSFGWSAPERDDSTDGNDGKDGRDDTSR